MNRIAKIFIAFLIILCIQPIHAKEQISNEVSNQEASEQYSDIDLDNKQLFWPWYIDEQLFDEQLAYIENNNLQYVITGSSYLKEEKMFVSVFKDKDNKLIFMMNYDYQNQPYFESDIVLIEDLNKEELSSFTTIDFKHLIKPTNELDYQETRAQQMKLENGLYQINFSQYRYASIHKLNANKNWFLSAYDYRGYYIINTNLELGEESNHIFISHIKKNESIQMSLKLGYITYYLSTPNKQIETQNRLFIRGQEHYELTE